MQALLYDVHGNLPALEAVLADARAAGADRWLLGGDYALFGGWPEDCVERAARAVRCRLDPRQRRALDSESGRRAGQSRRPGRDRGLPGGARGRARRSLAALPFDHADGDTYACHASPVSDVRSFMPEPADDEAELLEGSAPRRLVFGHTHLPFRRERRGIELVNPGSVGMPFDGDPRAAYALVHDDGTLEHRRLGYDHAAAAARVRERFGEPWADVVARRIEQARMVD